MGRAESEKITKREAKARRILKILNKIDKKLAKPLYIRFFCGIIIVGVEGFHT